MRLRNFTIKSKLYGMVAFSAFVLAVMLALSIWCLATFRVNGPVYTDVVRNRDVVTDILPPPMNIDAAYQTVHEAEEAKDPARLPELDERLARLEADYDAHFDKWQRDLPDGADLKSALRESAGPAREFFRLARDEYFPALARGDHDAADALLSGPLQRAYARHRAAIDRAVNLAVARTAVAEHRAGRRVDFWMRALILISMASLVVLTVVCWPVAREIVRSTAALIRGVERIARGEPDLATRVRVDSNDEMGRLAEGINATIGKMQEVVHRAHSAEEDLREVSDRLSLATRAAGIGIWDWDVVNNTVIWDDTMYRLYGVRREDFGGAYDAWLAALHPDDRERSDAEVRDALRSMREYTPEFRVVWADGSVHYIQTIARIFRDAQGHATRMAGVNYDVTARKEAEDDLRHAKEAAEAASRAKDNFIAVVSHELRTPLTPVLGKILLMERDPRVPHQVRPGLEMMRRNIELEVRLIEDLLDVHAIMRGKLRLELSNADAHESLRATVETLATEIADKRHTIDLDLRAERHFVRADPARLQQVFWNLLGNSVKYTPPGGRIVLRTRDTPDGRLRVEVTDNGIGVAADTLTRIFHPFVQGEQTLSRHYGGLGLGLTISKSLVEAHHGTLTVESPGKGQGTTSTVELPALPAAAAAAEESPARPSAAPVGPPGRRLRILLVEDDADTLRVMTRLLRLAKHEVQAAMTLHEALKVARGWDFDLLVSDIGLPDGTGWDLMAQLRRQRPTRPTKGIAMSGFVTDEDVHRSKDAGFDRHLAKPLKLDVLESAIQTTMRAA